MPSNNALVQTGGHSVPDPSLEALSQDVSDKIEKLSHRKVHNVAVVGIGLNIIFVYILSDKDTDGILFQQVKKEFADNPKVKVEKTTTPIAY